MLNWATARAALRPLGRVAAGDTVMVHAAAGAPELFGELMGELSQLIAAGVLPPGRPTVHDLADGPRVLAALEARATTGKLVLRP